MITIRNNGPHIEETNYFDSEMAEDGLLYLSWNAGAARLLVPDVQAIYIPEMLAVSEVVLSRGSWPIRGKKDALEILFDDDSISPLALHLSEQQWSWMLKDSDSGKSFPFSVWSRKGLAGKHIGHFRRVCELPNLQPWNLVAAQTTALESVVDQQIEETGCMIIAVPPPVGRCTAPSYAYTIGLCKIGQPELMMVMQDIQQCFKHLSSVYNQLKNDRFTMPINDEKLDVLESSGHSSVFRFQKIDSDDVLHLTPVAKKYAREYSLRLEFLLVSLADENGRFPGELGCDPAFTSGQDLSELI